MRAAVVTCLVLLLLTGCGHSVDTLAPQTATVLEAGKSDVELTAGDYLAPEGFRPQLRLTVPTGWRTTHRGPDAFDLTRPRTDADAPLVVIGLFAQPSGGAAEVVRLAGRRPRSEPVTQDVGGQLASGVDVRGGSGELVRGSAGTISLDAQPHGRVRLLTLDDLLIVVVVPRSADWKNASAAAAAVLLSAKT